MACPSVESVASCPRICSLLRFTPIVGVVEAPPPPAAVAAFATLVLTARAGGLRADAPPILSWCAPAVAMGVDEATMPSSTSILSLLPPPAPLLAEPLLLAPLLLLFAALVALAVGGGGTAVLSAFLFLYARMVDSSSWSSSTSYRGLEVTWGEVAKG